MGDINFRMKELPVIQLAVTQLPVIEMAVKELPDINLNANLAITKIPDVRAHLPAHFDLGVSLLGFELLRLSVCGEAQVITEPYEPRRLEICA